jgi:hypothetical protein
MSMNPPLGSRSAHPLGRSALGGLTSPNRTFGGLFGAVYVLTGLVGFAVTSGVGFASTQGKSLLIFGLNPLHNLVHIAVGALFLAGAALGERSAARVNALVGAVYLLVGVVGLFAIGHSFNILALNQADNALHFATALLALAFGVYGLSRARTAEPALA